ncbi:hypothetical protein [Brevibacillus brevis]|uniref:hypothetical protein n=1 Tax=Brevibacillus brevis TaxID=1393 RepID=UPI001EDB58E2|nr:hypothetical protein [Brevibacillus brevis]UKK99891.1 hypothetical protein FO446_21805 [Brevibacillus brevis]
MEMARMDESIIGMLNELSGEDAQPAAIRFGPKGKNRLDVVNKSFITVGEERIPMEDKHVLDDLVQIRLPKTFSIMSPEVAALKYPSERRPSLIFTNETASINLAFTYTESKLTDSPAQLKAFMDVMKQVLRRTQPLARWQEEGIREIAGTSFGFFEFVAPALDTDIYNLISFVSLQGRALLCTFNCTEQELTDWKPVGWGIMDSLSLVSTNSDENGKGEGKI